MGPMERTKLFQVLCIKDEGFKCCSLETCIFTVLKSDGYVCLKVSIFLLSHAWFFPFFLSFMVLMKGKTYFQKLNVRFLFFCRIGAVYPFFKEMLVTYLVILGSLAVS